MRRSSRAHRGRIVANQPPTGEQLPRPEMRARRSSRPGGNIATWGHTFVLQRPTTRVASSVVGSFMLGEATLGSVIAALLGLAILSAGAAALAGLLLVTAVGLGLYARQWLSLAGRSRVGPQSEDEVQRALAPLQAEGWRLRHSLPWQGRGDIDSVAIAPGAIAIALETKTRTYDRRHLARVREQAAWLARRRRRWARSGALAVMCIVRSRGVERVEDGVLEVSIDRLRYIARLAAEMGSRRELKPTRAPLTARRTRTLRCEPPAHGTTDGACAPRMRERERGVRQDDRCRGKGIARRRWPA